MATFSVERFTDSTRFNPTTGENTGTTSFGLPSVYSDNDGSDPFFQANEAVTISFPGTVLEFSGTFLGFVNVEGVPRPVFNIVDNNSTVLIGAVLDPTSFPNLASIGLQTQPFQECFLAGTHVATPQGETRVEALQIGDLVMTLSGCAVPVTWVGHLCVSTFFGTAERLMPVRVTASALGEGLPRRDLVLTADHALLIDGLLINAGALVNGGSIDWVPQSVLGERYMVYHIETEDHDVILAEGAPAETFIDYLGRQAFDNYAEYVALYGEDRTIQEMPFPRISSARMLPAAFRQRLRAPVTELPAAS